MTIEPSLLPNISHRENAKDLWDHLKKRFSVTSGPKNQQIKADLANCKQQGTSVEDYFGKLTKIWDSVANYRPIRRCTCGQCVCDLLNLLEKDREEDQVQQFLYGLDDRMFHTIRSTLTARVPLPTLEEAYNLVKQEEDLNNNNQIREEKAEVTAFAAYTKPRFSNSRDNNNSMVCKHCHRSGHLSESCFAVVGYPEWWGDRPRSRNTQTRGRGKAAPPRSAVFANAVTIASVSTAIANHVLTDHDRDAVSGLTNDQWHSVLNLINAGRATATETLSGKYSNPAWILDSGASHHMTGKLDLLTDLRDIPPVLVILADGSERITVKEGTVLLGSHLILRSVFYVPEMKSDLISMGQLMDENKCVVQLADHFLVIQDRITRMVTGVGKREEGTFYFRGIESLGAVSTRSGQTHELWQKCLGHPSAQVVSLLPDVLSSSLNKACDTCLRAKQTRDCFPISTNKTSRFFELIHTDVWGPYRTPSFSGARYFLTVVDDYSRSVWIYLMIEKRETKNHLTNYMAMVERQFEVQVKTVRSDNGT